MCGSGSVLDDRSRCLHSQPDPAAAYQARPKGPHRTPQIGERRVTDVLTVSKFRLFTETEVARPEAVGDDAEPMPDEAIGQPAA